MLCHVHQFDVFPGMHGRSHFLIWQEPPHFKLQLKATPFSSAFGQTRGLTEQIRLYSLWRYTKFITSHYTKLIKLFLYQLNQRLIHLSAQPALESQLCECTRLHLVTVEY